MGRKYLGKAPRAGYTWNPLKKFPPNSKCWCGSKAKAKKCCLPKAPTVVRNHEAKLFHGYMEHVRTGLIKTTDPVRETWWDRIRFWIDDQWFRLTRKLRGA